MARQLDEEKARRRVGGGVARRAGRGEAVHAREPRQQQGGCL
jgi:hypothetical protein